MLVIVAIFLPVLGALGAWHPRWRQYPEFPVLAAAVGVVAAVVAMVFGHSVAAVSWWQVVPGLALRFQADNAGLLFALLAAALWVPATVYAGSYIRRHPHKRRRFFTFYALSLMATMGIALAANLFSLYLFYELLTLVTWPLVVHNGTPAAGKAGRVYLIYSWGGAGLVLAGMVGVWWLAGTLEFTPGGVLTGEMPVAGIRAVLLLLVAGFGVKAAVMPLHTWLPFAMAAPTPVSALLHAVAVVNAGCFGLLRSLYSVLGVSALERAGLAEWLVFLAVVTILLGSVIALRQNHLKKRLAYSTVSQLGYITLGIFSGNALFLAGSLLHFVNHALMKITLFFCAGAIITETGIEQISEMDGIGRRLPLVMGSFALAALGMIGIAPINGFQSKWVLIQGALGAGNYALIIVLMSSAMLNALYFLPIIGAAFFRGDSNWCRERLTSGLVWPPVLTALLCIVLGLFPSLVYPYIADTVHVLMQ